MDLLKILAALAYLTTILTELEDGKLIATLFLYQQIISFNSRWTIPKTEYKLIKLQNKILDLCLSNPEVFKVHFYKEINNHWFDPYEFFTNTDKRQLKALSEVVREAPYTQGKFSDNYDDEFLFACLMGKATVAYNIYKKHEDKFSAQEYAQAVHDNTIPGRNPYEDDYIKIEDFILTKGLHIAFELKHKSLFDDLVYLISCDQGEVLVEYCTELYELDITKENLDMLEILKERYCIQDSDREKINKFIKSYEDKDVEYAFPNCDDDDDDDYYDSDEEF